MRRFAVLVALAALLLPVFAQSARAADPAWADGVANFRSTDGCIFADFIYFFERSSEYKGPAGVDLEIHISGSDLCTGEDFQIVTGGWISSATGLDMYTGGASLNMHARSPNYAPGYEGDEYEVWTSLQIKCTSIYARYHPGVNCNGVLSGHVSFGKWTVTVPSGTPAGLSWGGSVS